MILFLIRSVSTATLLINIDASVFANETEAGNQPKTGTVTNASLMNERNNSNFDFHPIGSNKDQIISNAMPFFAAHGMATTNPAPDGPNMLVFKGEKRDSARILVDECLTRGISNSLSIHELTRWAINVIDKEQKIEADGGRKMSRRTPLNQNDIPEALRGLSKRIPSVKYALNIMPQWYLIVQPDLSPPTFNFVRNQTGKIVAIDIGWHIYGILVGQKSFSPKLSELIYQHKIADGVYAYHGYD
jgi:hypothetical protein